MKGRSYGMNLRLLACIQCVCLLCTLPCISGHGDQVQDESLDPFVFQSSSLPVSGDVENTRYMPSVGNGHLATNVYTDTIYMNGLYTGKLGWSYRARIPALHASNLTVQDADPDDTQRTYRMDIRRGVYEEIITTPEVNVTYRTYAHHFYNRLLVTEIHIASAADDLENVNVSREDLSGNSTRDINFNDSEEYEEGVCGDPDWNCKQMTGKITEAETVFSDLTPVYLYWTEMPQDFSMSGLSGSESWTFLMSMDITPEGAKADFDEAMTLIENGTLYDKHVENWAEVWDQGYLEVEGDDINLLKIVYGCFYYLFSNLPSHKTNSPNNQFYGLSPGGLANGRNGSDYYGHVFWDMETWMYPPILLFRPDLAKEMLSYRINGMEPAFERAALHEHQGTRFPWESAYTGVEVTPDICPKCRENQQHITGDIAFAARQYISATRDTDFLTHAQSHAHNYTGFQFIREMARFWFSRPSYNFTKERFEVKGVMAPDEHAEEVDNSITTNVVASLAIHFARYAACLAGEDEATMVPDRWLNVAENLYFPFNPEKRYHEEYERYDWELENDASDPRGVKQADVALMGFPFLWDMPNDVRRNDLVHYENRTHPAGPAMTWGIYTIGWLDYDDTGKAAELFNRSYQPYVLQPFKVWTEAYEGIGAVNFITGQGGFLQALISGYAGLRLHVEELRFKRHVMPNGLTKMRLRRLSYLGSELDIEFNSTHVKVKPRSVSDEFPLKLYQTDPYDSVDLTAGVEVTFPGQEFQINTTTSSGCQLPADSINVNYDIPTILPPTTTDGEVSAGGSCVVAMATIMAAMLAALLF